MAVCSSVSPPARLARRPSSSPAAGESHSPSEKASWRRTRISGSSTRRFSAWPSASPWSERSSGSLTRMACSRTPGWRSRMPAMACPTRSWPRPSSVQSAWSRAFGLALVSSSLANGRAAFGSPRCMSRRWAVSRCQPLGLSSAATSCAVSRLCKSGIGLGLFPSR